MTPLLLSLRRRIMTGPELWSRLSWVVEDCRRRVSLFAPRESLRIRPGPLIVTLSLIDVADEAVRGATTAIAGSVRSRWGGVSALTGGLRPRGPSGDGCTEDWVEAVSGLLAYDGSVSAEAGVIVRGTAVTT